jgi:hypothetical protein
VKALMYHQQQRQQKKVGCHLVTSAVVHLAQKQQLLLLLVVWRQQITQVLAAEADPAVDDNVTSGYGYHSIGYSCSRRC